jgi:hypothetical protein
VKVVLFTFSPTPPELSATLPPKLPGTVAVRRVLPLAGVVTEAVIGGVLSVLTVIPALAWELPLPTAYTV